MIYASNANIALGIYVQARAEGNNHDDARKRAFEEMNSRFLFITKEMDARADDVIEAARVFVGEVDAMRRESEDARAALLARDSELLVAQNRIGELAESLANANAEIEGLDIILTELRQSNADAELRPEPTPADMGIDDETDATTSSEPRESSQGETEEQD